MESHSGGQEWGMDKWNRERIKANASVDYWVFYCYWWLVLDSVGSSKEPYEIYLKMACGLRMKRRSVDPQAPFPCTPGSCIHVYWAVFHACLLSQWVSWPRPEVRNCQVVLIKYWSNACQSLNMIECHCSAPGRGRAKRIWKDIQVAGKKGDLLDLFRRCVIPNDEGNISSFSST